MCRFSPACHHHIPICVKLRSHPSHSAVTEQVSPPRISPSLRGLSIGATRFSRSVLGDAVRRHLATVLNGKVIQSAVLPFGNLKYLFQKAGRSVGDDIRDRPEKEYEITRLDIPLLETELSDSHTFRFWDREVFKESGSPTNRFPACPFPNSPRRTEEAWGKPLFKFLYCFFE
jgi:hypothetical protein